MPILVENAFDSLSVDVLGPFPPSRKGNGYIGVFFFQPLSYFWCEVFPVPCAKANVIARGLVNEIFARHGAPKSLFSDRGKNLLPKFVNFPDS